MKRVRNLKQLRRHKAQLQDKITGMEEGFARDLDYFQMGYKGASAFKDLFAGLKLPALAALILKPFRKLFRSVFRKIFKKAKSNTVLFVATLLVTAGLFYFWDLFGGPADHFE
jgi:hypothetical protein